MKPLVIYHGNCADGFTSAWVANRYFGGEVDLHAGVYQTEPPDVTNRDVYLVDFSYKRPVLEAMRERARRVVVLDHHKTAEADLRDLPGVETVFDMNRSGATIAWGYWFGGTDAPPALLHVEDRDLWRFALPGTREIQANLFSYPYDLAVWDRLMWSDPEALISDGRAIERKHHKDIAELVGVVTRRMMIAGYNVPVANLPYTLTSDAGHCCARRAVRRLLLGHAHGPGVFAPLHRRRGGRVGDRETVRGGGHRNASGFTVPYTSLAQFDATT